MAWKPTRAQFFALGLPAESCVAPARAIATVDTSTDSFLLPGHGLTTGDAIRFTASGTSYDSTAAALPSPLSATTMYEAVASSGDVFQARASGGGAVVNLTTTGTGVVSVVPDWLPKLDTILDYCARWCDDHATPYLPPWGPTDEPPASLVKVACELAAYRFSMVCRAASPSYTIEDLRAAAEAAQAWLDELRSGKPLAIRHVDSSPGRPEMGARAFSRRPARGWKVGTL